MTWVPELIDTTPPADTLVEGAVKINSNIEDVADHINDADIHQDASTVAITGGTITGLSSPLPVASGGTGSNSGSIQGTGGLSFTSGGATAVTLKPGTDSTTGVKLANAAGTAVLNVDTTNSIVTVAGSLSDSHIYNVRTYGATGDGTTDDTAAINAAIAAMVAHAYPAAVLYFPRGWYKSTGAHAIAKSGITIRGDGNCSIIEIAHATNNLFEVLTPSESGTSSTSFLHIRDLKIVSQSVTRTGGWVFYSDPSIWMKYCRFTDLQIEYQCNGFYIPMFYRVWFTRISGPYWEPGTSTVGIKLGKTAAAENEVPGTSAYIESCAFKGEKTTATNGLDVGIKIIDCDSTIISDTCIYMCADKCVTVEKAVHTPTYVWIYDSDFDSTTNGGIDIQDTYYIRILGVWIGSIGPDLAGSHNLSAIGLYIHDSVGVQISDTHIFGCKGPGLHCDGSRGQISNCLFTANGAGAQSGLTQGIKITQGSVADQSFLISNCVELDSHTNSITTCSNSAGVCLVGNRLEKPVSYGIAPAVKLGNHTTGDSNTAVGVAALTGLTTGVQNTAVGVDSLKVNSIGTNNTACGRAALTANTTGTNNTAVGNAALSANTVGGNNAAIGNVSLKDNTTGINNTAVGAAGLQYNTVGYNNSAVGYQALVLNTTGYNNSAIGVQALYANTTGINNTAVGVAALYASTIGTGLSALGYAALTANTTGTNNTAVGYQALGALTTGTNCTGIGNGAAASAVDATNEITLGNSSVATLRCQVTTITALSDERDKTNVYNVPVGLRFIRRLKPREFEWNMRDGAKVGVRDFGFIAQELQEAQTDEGITVPGLVFDANPERLETSPGVLVTPMVAAIQELADAFEQLKADFDTYRSSHP